MTRTLRQPKNPQKSNDFCGFYRLRRVIECERGFKAALFTIFLPG